MTEIVKIIVKLWGGLTLSSLSWARFPVFSYTRGYVKGKSEGCPRNCDFRYMSQRIWRSLRNDISTFYTLCVPGHTSVLAMKTGYFSKLMNQAYSPSILSILVSYFFPQRSQFWFNICGLSSLKNLYKGAKSRSVT